MDILITGIGCIGKSSLREKITSEFPDKVISVDMDYNKHIPQVKQKIVVVESIHGLEENPQKFDRIMYLLPPRRHTVLWLRRAWIWFSTGIVDLHAPKSKTKQFAFSNIPVILKILMRNLLMRKKWVKSDLSRIENELKDKTYITPSVEEGFKTAKIWIRNNMNFSRDKGIHCK